MRYAVTRGERTVRGHQRMVWVVTDERGIEVWQSLSSRQVGWLRAHTEVCRRQYRSDQPLGFAANPVKEGTPA